MRKELRTKPDVASGILVDEGAGDVRIVTYEPGNGTRYSVVLTNLGGLRKADYVLGPGSATLAYVSNHGRAIVLERGRAIDYHRVQEVMRCSIFDAVVLAELLGHLTGVEHTTVEGFVQEMAG